MLISIVIPVFNRASVVGRTLESVATQTHRPLQVVLVDNDSTDDTWQVLQDFKAKHEADDFEVVVVQETATHTAAAARQRGFELSTGDYVTFFDSDDEMSPDLIAAYAQVLDDNLEVDLILTGSQTRHVDGSVTKHPFHRSDFIANHILHSILSATRYLVRREFFAATDGWNINVLQWDDWELGLRLLLHRPRVKTLPGSSRITVIESGEASITGNDFSSRAGRWEYAIDVNSVTVRSSRLKPERRLRFVRLLEYRRMVLAAHYEREGRPDLARPLCRCAVKAIRETYTTRRMTAHGVETTVSRRYRWVVEPTLRRLFAHIVAGRRGAARIARILF